jgi:hypothetical protein
MHLAGIDDMEAGPGEAGFLLQLRPPPCTDPERLADQVERFTGRYLAARGPREGRFARLGPLTWALAAPQAVCHRVHETAQALGEALFGTAEDTVWLIERGPGGASDGCEESDPASEDQGWDIDTATSLDLEAAAFDLDSLTEPPERAGGPDIAGELAAFRIEMRAIARAIPDAADREREALGAFREELHQLTRDAGDRFDAAAGRIETATASLPDAAARVEASAVLMETSVREALEALTRACAAMGASRDGASRAG